MDLIGWLTEHGAGTVVPVRMAGYDDDDGEVSPP